MSADFEHQEQEYRRMAEAWQEEAVPHWHRNRHLVQSQRQAAPLWLSWGAIAASLIAMVLSLSRAEIDFSQGLNIRFGGKSEAELRQLALQTMMEAGETQSAVVDARLTQFALDLERSNQLLFATWQQANERERQTELNMLVNSWRTQRFEDRQELNNRFNQVVNDQLQNTRYINAILQNAARPGRSTL